MNEHNSDNLIGFKNIETDQNDIVTIAKKWADDSIRAIITPVDNLQDLEDQWNNYNSMIKKNRRESDWKSIELFGMTNQDHYENIKSKLLDKDIDNVIDGDTIPPIYDGDDPVIESYIDLDAADSYYNSDAINYTSEDVEKAKTWSKDNDKYIIIPTRTLEELESLWDLYNMMIKKHKRESDWISQDLFGVTNLKHYEYLKAQFLREDINKEEIDDSNFMIESTITHNDAKKYIKSLCKNGDICGITESFIGMIKPQKSIYEELIVDNIISDAINTYDMDTCSNMDIPCSDMPYFSPEEMIDKGVLGQTPVDNYYGVSADNSMLNEDISVKEWFDMYVASNDGFYTDMGPLSTDWVNKVRELSFGLQKMKESKLDENLINARKQSILELGWNPEIPFSDRARKLAREMAINRIKERSYRIRTIDLREFVNNISEKMVYSEKTESLSEHDLVPIYVVLTEGKSGFSGAIKFATKSMFSHASLSFDHKLEKMYSYAIQGRPGFREENIKNTDKDSKINVYVFFVSNKVYSKMASMTNYLSNNINKTNYSYVNIVTYLFNIPYNHDHNMICSQFVDRTLKASGVDISKVDSSLIAPADLDNYLKNEKRVYLLYSGLWTKYKPSKIKNTIKTLMRTATPIKEQNAYCYNSEANYINAIANNASNLAGLIELYNYRDIVQSASLRNILENIVFDSIRIYPYTEAKEFPIQFDNDGNLLINNVKTDYESEYAKSHKLLKEYLKEKNADGMKYELAKLWMLNCMLEEVIYSEKFKRKTSNLSTSSEYKARSKILNDFKFYLKELLKLEKDFNFTEYFESSPFNYKSIKINKTTISAMNKLIKEFIRQF